MKAASEQAISDFLAANERWALLDGKLRQDFKFGDFSEAFAFMTRSAMVAETMNHHPEWFNVYNRVRVELTTHDANGISELDFEMARQMDVFAT
ncbi:MAG: 4a-hydroxytetrahydrobiopterin dehydratase [Woeseiaceae bacterium]